MNGKQLIHDIEECCKSVSSLQWQKKMATAAIYLLPSDFDDGWTCSFENISALSVGYDKLIIECRKPKNYIRIVFYSDSIISFINEIQMSALDKPDINTMLLNLESHIETFCNYNEEDIEYVGGAEQIKKLFGTLGDIRSLYYDGIFPPIDTFGDTKIDICSCVESDEERNARLTKELIGSLKETINDKIEHSDETSTVSMNKTDMLNMLNEILDVWERKT